MINNISWSEYSYITALLLLTYYAVVLFFFYKEDVSHFLNKKPAGFNKPEIYNNTSFDEMSLVRCCLQSIIQDLSGKNSPKEEIVFALRSELSRFQGMVDNNIPVINSFINEEIKRHCSIWLTEEDMKVLWMK